MKGDGKKGWAPDASPEPDLWDVSKTDRETFIVRMRSAFGQMGAGQDFGKTWDEMKAKREKAAPDGEPDR